MSKFMVKASIYNDARKNNTILKITLTNGNVLEGIVVTFDDEALLFIITGRQIPAMINNSAIIMVEPAEGGK